MRRRLGAVLAILAVVAVFVQSPLASGVALALAVAAVVAVDPRLFAAAARPAVAVVLVVAASLTGAAVAASAGAARGLEVAGGMLARLAVLVLLGTLAARTVDSDAVVRWAARLRMERLGLVLGLGLNVLPRLVSAAAAGWTAVRVRRRCAGRAPGPVALAEVLLAHTARLGDEAAAAAALRGHGVLVGRPAQALATTRRLVVVTGPPGSGKTPAVTEAARRLEAAGVRVAGFVQPARRRDGVKDGFDVLDLATGRSAVLATRAEERHGDHGTAFRFDQGGFRLAASALRGARGAEVAVVDELGPVELRGEGHMPAVRSMVRRRRRPAILVVVVRRPLVPSLVAALDAADVELVDVERCGDPAAAVVTAVERSSGQGQRQ